VRAAFLIYSSGTFSIPYLLASIARRAGGRCSVLVERFSSGDHVPEGAAKVDPPQSGRSGKILRSPLDAGGASRSHWHSLGDAYVRQRTSFGWMIMMTVSIALQDVKMFMVSRLYYKATEHVYIIVITPLAQLLLPLTVHVMSLFGFLPTIIVKRFQIMICIGIHCSAI
jgi:hypothetical protein